jgi:hypothetical protein
MSTLTSPVLAYKIRRLARKWEIYHLLHGWVELINIGKESVKIKRYDARDGWLTYYEPNENFKLSGEA